MKAILKNRLTQYFILLITLINWSLFSLLILGKFFPSIFVLCVCIGFIYFPFISWILKIKWRWTIPMGYFVSMLSILLTILIVDFGFFYYPDEFEGRLRPIFEPIFKNIINEPYAIDDFFFMFRILLNSIISIILIEIVYKIKNKNGCQ